MDEDLARHDHDSLNAAADHVTEARQRARKVFGSEAHISNVDDWRRAIVSARDALILIWLIWVALQGFGGPAFTGLALVALAVALALVVGISTGRSTYVQVRYYESELDRERSEIRDCFEQECEEVRALYAAKGFREPVLSQVVDTLTSDEDRLLKLMMEEELGLSMQHINHPLLVGLWNFTAALAGGVMLALPVVWLSPQNARMWMVGGGALLMGVASAISAGAAKRRFIEVFTTGILMAAFCGGVVYLLSQWLAGFVGGASEAS